LQNTLDIYNEIIKKKQAKMWKDSTKTTTPSWFVFDDTPTWTWTTPWSSDELDIIFSN
jgi:hypothetical protein